MADTISHHPQQAAPAKPARRDAALRRVLTIAGVMLGLQGLVTVALGPWMHFATDTIATADSDARFLGGLLLGVGAAWVYLARRDDIPYGAVALLAAGMLAGAVGRLLSLVVAGPMSLLAIPVTAIEFIVGTAIVILALRAQRRPVGS